MTPSSVNPRQWVELVSENRDTQKTNSGHGVSPKLTAWNKSLKSISITRDKGVWRVLKVLIYEKNIRLML